MNIENILIHMVGVITYILAIQNLMTALSVWDFVKTFKDVIH